MHKTHLRGSCAKAVIVLQQTNVRIYAIGMSRCLRTTCPSSAACMASGNQNPKQAKGGATSLYVSYRCVKAMVAVEFASFVQKEKKRLSLSASS